MSDEPYDPKDDEITKGQIFFAVFTILLSFGAYWAFIEAIKSLAVG